MTRNVLYSANFGGNTHETVDKINRFIPELIDHIMAMEVGASHYTIVVFRAPEALLAAAKARVNF